MENSAKNDWGKGRLVPVALLFLGLICASWITIGSEKNETKETGDIALQKDAAQLLILADTAKDGLKVIKKRNDVWNLEEPPAPGEPEPAEEFIEMWKDAPNHAFEFNFDEMVPPQAFEAPIPMMDMFNAPDILFAPDSDFFYQLFDSGDSVPAYRFRLRHPNGPDDNWDSFEQELREKFKSQFKDFYNKNQKQFDKMLEEMKNSEASRRDAAEVVDLDRTARWRESKEVMREMEMADYNRMIAEQKLSMEKMGFDEAQRAKKLSRDMAMLAAKQQVQAEKMRMDANIQLDVLNDQLARQSEMLQDMTDRFARFKEALTEQLTADGYIKPGEELDQININDNGGDMMINGTKIKEKDRVKYKALHDQYFTPDPVPVRRHGRSE